MFAKVRVLKTEKPRKLILFFILSAVIVFDGHKAEREIERDGRFVTPLVYFVDFWKRILLVVLYRRSS